MSVHMRLAVCLFCMLAAAPQPVGPATTVSMGMNAALIRNAAPVGGLSPQVNIRPVSVAPLRCAAFGNGGACLNPVGAWRVGGISMPSPNFPSAAASFNTQVAPAVPVFIPFQPWTDPTQATLTVELPADAELWVQGRKTLQDGTVRQFVTPTPIAGLPYTLELRATWRVGDRLVEASQSVTVRGGASANVKWLR